LSDRYIYLSEILVKLLLKYFVTVLCMLNYVRIFIY